MRCPAGRVFLWTSMGSKEGARGKRDGERKLQWCVETFPVKGSGSESASMWIVWGCNDGVRLHRQRSASGPRGKASTTWCHQRGPGMTHGPQTREVHRNFNEIPLHKEPINSILLLWRNKSTAKERDRTHHNYKCLRGITPLNHFLPFIECK